MKICVFVALRICKKQHQPKDSVVTYLQESKHSFVFFLDYTFYEQLHSFELAVTLRFQYSIAID